MGNIFPILVIHLEMPAPSSVLDCRPIYLYHSQRRGLDDVEWQGKHPLIMQIMAK